MTDREERERKAAQYRKLSLLSTVGLMFPSSIGVGIAIGYTLDWLLGTTPWLVMVFALLGIAAGFVNLFRVVSKFDKSDD